MKKEKANFCVLTTNFCSMLDNFLPNNWVEV